MKILIILISYILCIAAPVFSEELSGLDIMKEQKKRHEAGQNMKI